jgi:hypothetical protein
MTGIPGEGKERSPISQGTRDADPLSRIRTEADLAQYIADLQDDARRALIGGNFLGYATPETNRLLAEIAGSLAVSEARISSLSRPEGLPAGAEQSSF